MPRQARKDLVSNFVHIMCQGINKEYIFENDYFKEKYRKILQEKITDYDINLICYCIMDNHVHLVANYKYVDELSTFMKRLNTAYAKWYNDHKGRVGYVFRDRYKTEQILDYHHLYSCIIYAHNNPVKAKIVSKPEQYRFSSYRNYLSDDYILNSKILKFLDLSVENFKKIFIKSINSEDFCFRGKSPERVINEYLKEKNVKDIEEIISKNELKELVLRLKELSNLKYDEIAQLLKISRSTLYRIRND